MTKILPASPDEAFECDVPEHLREDVLIMICEALHDENHTHKDVTILNRDWFDVINVRGNGSIQIGDNEYRFIAESGNRWGFVLEDWEGDRVFEPAKRTQWTIAPSKEAVSQAIVAGHGPFLIQKWNLFLTRADVSDILQAYSYDRHFQPGSLIENHYRARAAKLGLRIVSDEHAAEIRKQLAEAIQPRVDVTCDAIRVATGESN